jgi:hypothetical protein
MLYLPWRFQKSRVLHCKFRKDDPSLTPLSSLTQLHSIREWVIHQYPSVSTSTHWWFKDLPADIKDLFYNIAKDKKIIEMFRKSVGKGYYIDLLHDMNEVYVSPPSNHNKDFVKNASDNIFYTRHIDGPFFSIPFASCYRVIVGLDENKDIMTIFNLTSQSYIIKTGDVVGFDFHRECHYISPIIWNDEAKPPTETTKNTKYPMYPKYRVVLKIHYCVYPYWACIFGYVLSKLSILYNKLFRDLFLFTLKPKRKSTTYIAKLMILSTQVYHDIEFYIGNNNIQYVSLLLYVASKTHSNVFLFGSSFVHYIRWIDTEKHGYKRRNTMADGEAVADSDYTPIFKRDYYVFKFLYMLNYFHMYFSYSTENPVIYTSVIVPPLFALYLCNNYAAATAAAAVAIIPKSIEIYLTCAMLNHYALQFTEYIYLFLNIFFNYTLLSKTIDM